MDSIDKNYYSLLNITKEADQDDIKKAYRKAALEHHPDKGGTDQMFHAIKEAYDILSDPIKKRNYDRDLKKYGFKDGIKKTKSSNSETTAKASKPQFKKESTTTDIPKEEAKSRKQTESAPKRDPFVEIPSDLNSLSIKELKSLMSCLGLSHDDWFEKQDMINRIQELSRSKKDSKPEYTRSTTEIPKKAESRSESRKPAEKSSSTSGAASFAGTMDSEDVISFKILSIGNQEVGKSWLIKRYCEGRFVKRYITTIGIDYGVKKMSLDGSQVSINFFDLSGNDDYKIIREEFYNDSEGIFMVYDVDNRDSFVNLSQWEAEMKRHGIDTNEVQVVVCANKVDGKGREVSTAEGQKWWKSRNYSYFETSANTGLKVSEAFEWLFLKVLENFRVNRKKFGLS